MRKILKALLPFVTLLTIVLGSRGSNKDQTKCKPEYITFEDCNVCWCDVNGKAVNCTDLDCHAARPKSNDTVCTPAYITFQHCNVCWCDNEGISVECSNFECDMKKTRRSADLPDKYYQSPRKIPLLEAHAVINSPNANILFGKPAEIGQFPYAAKVVSGNAYPCGGALVRQNVIVTAAQCVYREKSWTVYLGCTSADVVQSTQIILETDTGVIYPGYFDGDLRNDIAVIRLKRNVALDQYTNVVKLPYRTMQLLTFAGRKATLATWEFTHRFIDPKGVLHYHDIDIISNVECQNYYLGETLFPSEMCGIGPKDGAVCEIDAGSPLVYEEYEKFYLIGVASFMSTVSCTKPHANGFTRVNTYVKWIRGEFNPK